MLMMAVFSAIACAATDSVPVMRLPDQATPLGYTLELTVVPAADDYAGVIAIDLELKSSTQLL